jgi:hypothetical protein
MNAALAAEVRFLPARHFFSTPLSAPRLIAARQAQPHCKTTQSRISVKPVKPPEISIASLKINKNKHLTAKNNVRKSAD